MTTRDEALEAPSAAVLLLLQLDFRSGTNRVTNWSHSLDYFGYTWTALGGFIGMSPVEESEDLRYPAVDIQVNLAESSWLSLVLGSAHEYRGRQITIWQGLLDDALQQAGDPEVIWAGEMDQVRFKTGDGEREGEQAAAVLRCEMAGRDTRAPQSLRLTHAQHIARHPGDTFLSRIERLSGQPQPWLSKRFQWKD